MWNERWAGWARCSVWACAVQKNMFGGSPPPPPAVQPPPTMPDPLNAQTLAAQQRAMQTAATGGRLSTILTTRGSRTPAATIAGGAGAYTAGKLSG